MESLYLLIPVSVILVFAIGVAFWFSLKGGQYEDMEGPAYRIVMDDDLPPKQELEFPDEKSGKNDTVFDLRQPEDSTPRAKSPDVLGP